MPNVKVFISTVRDGNMLDRNNTEDAGVIANRETFLAKHAISIDQTTRLNVMYDQEDFCKYLEVGDEEKGLGMRSDDIVIADALITTTIGQALFLPLADCVGAVFYDPKNNVLMLSHLGRHSLEQNGGYRSVQYLQQNHGCTPQDLLVWLTPAPGKDVYKIWKLDNKGMKEAALEQLVAAGISSNHIIDSPIDTDKDSHYYSHSEFLAGHRADDGRYAIVAVIES